MVFRIAFWTTLILSCPGSIQAQSPEPQTTLPAGQGSEDPTQPAPADANDAPVQADKVSDAEKIARLQRTIEENSKQIEELSSRLNDPENEYNKAEADFGKVDGELEEANKTVEKLKSDNRLDQAESLESTLPDLQTRRELAKQRFDLAIEGRKTTQQQLATLEHKLETDREALSKLTAPINKEPAETPDPKGTAHPTESSPGSAADAAAPSPPPGREQTPTTAELLGGSSTQEAVPVNGTQTTDATDTQTTDDQPPSEELVKAREEATTKETAARDAEQEAESVTDRLEQTQSEIALVRKRLNTARQQADNAQETERAFNDELQKKWDQGAPRQELGDLRVQIRTARERYNGAMADVRGLSDRLSGLQTERARLHSEQIAALQEAEVKRGEAQQAQEAVAYLTNPFTVENMLRWLLTHGLKVLLTIAGIFAALTFARILERRFVPVIMRAGVGGSADDRENRAKTLVGVFHNAARVVVIAGGLLVILTEIGVPVAPLLAGASVVGLAAAFGAQNLIKDYFYGFIILMENQYTVNDVIKIGDTAGLVERITLRMTVLRDLSGTVHFVPHGSATTVSNMTHGWSRAVFEIGVAYKEDVNQVMEVLMDLGREIRRDPEFSNLILDDPEMLGLDAFGDSAVVIKFFIKTRPIKQWTIKRELQRRIKIRFDELGIEIPFPHRTLYHIHEGGEPDGNA